MEVIDIITINLITNILLISLLCVLGLSLFQVIEDERKKRAMYSKISEDSSREMISTKTQFFYNYKMLIKKILTQKNIGKYADKVFIGIILFSVFLFIYFITIKQYFIGLFAPVVLNLFLVKIFQVSADDIDEDIENQLPSVIDVIIRVFSRYGDLKTIIYNTSQQIDNPLAEKFEQLSRNMSSDSSQEKALMKFADDLGNVWVYSLIYILLSYKEDAKKEDVIFNLAKLRDIIAEENDMKNKASSDKKYGIALNYFIAFLAFVGGIGNIVLNPIGKEYFFHSFQGALCFLIGYGCVFTTLITNIVMSKKKRRRG